MMDKVIFYKDWRDALAGLNPEERLKAYEAVFAYAFEGKEPASTLIEVATALMRSTIDRDNEKYQAKCERNKRNADARWKMQSHAVASNRMRSMQSHAVDANNNNNNNTNNNNNNKNKDIEKEKEYKKKKIFIKPTVEQVAAYCKERGNYIDAAQFVDFYEAKGWIVGKAPMKDWKAAVRTWEKRDGRPRRTEGAPKLGVGEYIEQGTGRRTYGTGRTTIPDDAPARPSEQYSWDSASQCWIVV